VFGEPPQIEFHGFNLEKWNWSAGTAIPLTFVWRALTDLDATWSVLVHLENGEGEVVAYGDGLPAHGFRPTSSWREGEVIIDERTLALPPDIPAGEYTLWAGLYHPDNGQRLGAYQGGVRLADDRVQLGLVRVGDTDE
jgi:hypothetical protein